MIKVTIVMDAVKKSVKSMTSAKDAKETYNGTETSKNVKLWGLTNMADHPLDSYFLQYSSALNLFVVINQTTRLAQSSWTNRRDAESCLKDLTRMKRNFIKNLVLRSKKK